MTFLGKLSQECKVLDTVMFMPLYCTVSISAAPQRGFGAAQTVQTRSS